MKKGEGLSKLDNKEIKRLIKLFPSKIVVSVIRSEDGGFSAEIKNFPGCFTQAENLSELIDMVSDAVRTYLEVPEKYLSYMPAYIPSLKLAQDLGMFPVITEKKELAFSKA